MWKRISYEVLPHPLQENKDENGNVRLEYHPNEGDYTYPDVEVIASEEECPWANGDKASFCPAKNLGGPHSTECPLHESNPHAYNNEYETESYLASKWQPYAP